MKSDKRLKELAIYAEKIRDILKELDMDELIGAFPEKAVCITGIRIKNKQLINGDTGQVLTNKGLIADKYYLYQQYKGDGVYYGYMYFSAGKRGEYIRIPFEVEE